MRNYLYLCIYVNEREEVELGPFLADELRKARKKERQKEKSVSPQSIERRE